MSVTLALSMLVLLQALINYLATSDKICKTEP